MDWRSTKERKDWVSRNADHMTVQKSFRYHSGVYVRHFGWVSVCEKHG